MVVFHSLEETALPDQGCCVALGLFDGLHLGHQAVIRAAVDQARDLGVDSCVFTFTTSGHRPAAKSTVSRLLPESLRDKLLAELGVDYLVCPPFETFRSLSPQEYVESILRDKFHARAVFCGENYHFGKGAAGSAADLRTMGEALGIETTTLPMTIREGGPVSSTRIRALIAQGDMQSACSLLGRPFAIDFEVIHGRHLGRTIESPTINQAFPDWLITPPFGVYASRATVDGVTYVSVSNIGVKPTVGSDRVLSETYIMGYDGQLYGQHVLVEFLQFVRPEMKFASIDALKQQIKKDCSVAKRVALQWEV